jgi:hypothetical protein
MVIFELEFNEDINILDLVAALEASELKQQLRSIRVRAGVVSEIVASVPFSGLPAIHQKVLKVLARHEDHVVSSVEMARKLEMPLEKYLATMRAATRGKRQLPKLWETVYQEYDGEIRVHYYLNQAGRMVMGV